MAPVNSYMDYHAYCANPGCFWVGAGSGDGTSSYRTRKEANYDMRWHERECKFRKEDE